MAAKATNGSAVVVSGSGAGQKNNQVINGGNGVDIINAALLFAADSTGTHTIVAGNGADIVNGSAFDEIIWGDGLGNSGTNSDNGADTLNGGGGKDEIHGGNGADIISGDGGADNLWGDRGGDLFRYNYNADSAGTGGVWDAAKGDWIRDFKASEGDRLDFSSLYANGQFGGVNPPDELQWSGTTPSAYGIWYGNDGTNTYVYADTSGDGVADIVIKVSGIVTFTPGNFLGVNQAPVAGDDVNAVFEDSSVSSSVAGNDSDPDSDTLSYSLNAPVAGLTLNANGSYTFDASDTAYQHLAAGATQQVVATYTVSDGHGGSDTATLTITVTGVNDLASISGDNDGDVYEDGVGYASGSLSVSDVDDGEAIFLAADSLDLDGAYGDFTFNALTGAWDFTLDNDAVQGLGANDTVTETLTVTSKDGTDTETITVTIHGVNDAATFGGTDTGAVTEDGTLGAGGTLTVSDIDDGESSFQAVAAAALVGVYGDFTFNDATGAWTYTLRNGDANVQALNAGDSPTDTLVVTSADGTTHNITVTVNGANEAPTYTSPPVYTGGGDPNDFDSLTGGAPNNAATIHGDNGDNVITGGGADQNLDGKNGMDVIYGGGGNDTITGDNDEDTLYGQAGDDSVSGENDDDIIYGGSGNDSITAGNGDDTVYGGSGNDTIVGSGDDDVIVGGYGADTLTGSNGNDTFRYLSNLDTGDTITDFAVGDKIDLAAFAPSAFIGLLASPGAVGPNQVGYLVSGGVTTLYVDTDGIAGADLEIYLSNGYVPLAGDFVL